MYQIGKITNTHGIKGEVKIYNLSDFNRFFVGAKIYVMLQGKKVEFPPGVEGTRFAYGRNGVGRHGLLCFNCEYKVITKRSGVKSIVHIK